MSAMASQDACTDDAKNKAATGNMEGKIFSEEKANKQVRDKAREVKTYTSLANAYYAHGDYKKAIEYYQLHLAKEVGDQAGEGLAYGNLGNAYQSLGDYKKAIEYHLLRLSFTEEVGDRAGEARAYGNLGNAYLSLSDYKKAIEYHQLHLNLAKEVGDRDEEGRANSNLGNSYHSLGQFETAKEYHQLDLGIAKEVGDKAAEGRAYGNLGNAYESLGDAIKAIHYHQLRLRIAKELGDRAGEGRAYGNLGNAYCSRGGFKKAIEYHQLHLSIAKEVGDRAGEGRANSNLGNAYCSLGNFIKAIECHKLYRSVAREMGNRDGEGRANGNLGNAHRRLGNFKKAIKYHELCLSITKEVGDRAGEGSAHGNLGNVYTSLGDFTKAIECLELRRSIAQEVGDRAGEGRAYGSLGNAYLSLDKYEEAVECYNQRRTIAQERGNKHGEGIAYGSLGNCYESLGDLPKAIENHQLCLSIAKEEGDRAGEAGTYCNLGNSYYRLDDFQKAIEYHQLDLSASKELKDRAGQGRAYCNLGHAYQSLGDLCQSESCYKSSVELFDNLRDRLKTNDEWKISLRDQYDEVYIGLMTVLLKQNKVNEALFTAERGRAQALMDLMKSQYGFSQKVAKDTKIVETLSYITSQTVFVAVGTEELNFWVLEKGKDVQFRKKKIDKASLKKDVITTLDSLTRDAKQEIGVNRDIQCENRTLDELEPIVENPADKKSEGKRMVAYSKDSPLRILYEMIINPIADLIHGYELTIVPDGPLFLVPFPAFLDHCSKFLCESFRIRLIPSLSSLKLLAECSERYHSESKALLVGEPRVKEVRRKRLDELPCAKKEVEMIGGILNVSPLVGKNATKAEVKKRLSSAAIVHIAAHGKMETGEIALSPKPWPERSSKIPKEDDYLLTMKDVLELKLRARLVVLSCCHSGRGEIKAEGVVGIARAFLGAGARSVLVSLWAINDEATLEFMRCFYQHLVEGRSVGEAINLARKALKESETLSDVKHWAPFMLIGDDITLDFGRKG